MKNIVEILWQTVRITVLIGLFFETVVNYHCSHGLIHIVKMAKALKKTVQVKEVLVKSIKHKHKEFIGKRLSVFIRRILNTAVHS